MSFSTTDTIVAIATPPGRGGIGVIRLSGSEAHFIARQLIAREEVLGPRHATLATVRSTQDDVAVRLKADTTSDPAAAASSGRSTYVVSGFSRTVSAPKAAAGQDRPYDSKSMRRTMSSADSAA